MVAILNITNGDSAVDVLRRAGIDGTMLPWRDVLHVGPVPAGISLPALSSLRAQFIAAQGWGKLVDVRQAFVDRDEMLASFEDCDRVRLWFEHDLYDQLQLLQVLDWFSSRTASSAKLSLICTEQYLGECSNDDIQAVCEHAACVTERQFELAQQAWAAFRSPTPHAWHDLLSEDTAALPFLHGAVLRMLEEYPDCTSGLSRTASQALRIIAEGEVHRDRVFARYQQTEARRFLGDSIFWSILDELRRAPSPLIAGVDHELSVTAIGQDVLAANASWLDVTTLDRWFGGVHLTAANQWCWNPASGSLSKIS